MKESSAVIVGGGISGLATAYFLSRRAALENYPLKITVLEASDRFGGVLRTLSCEDLQMEAGADAFYAGQSDTSDLCRELGLEEDLVEAAPCFRRFFGLKNQKPFPVGGRQDSFFDAARFLTDPRLSFFTKCRMLWEPFISRRNEAGDESLASFIRRRLGQGFYREAVQPLVQGVYMMDPEKLSLEALFSRLKEAEKIHGSLAGSFLMKMTSKKKRGRQEFLTLKHGLEELVQALVRELEKVCVLRCSVPVRKCSYKAGWEISLEKGPALRADNLCLAMNACDSSKLISVIAPELSRELSSVRYDSIATVSLAYKSEDVPARDTAPGFLVPLEGDEYPFSSLKWLGTSADGRYILVRTFLSQTMNPGLFNESDEALKRKVRVFLKDLFGVRAEPFFAGVQRYPGALPQYETGHLERVKRIEEKTREHPGLHLTGNGFHGFGITDCIRQARITASSLQLLKN